MHDCLFAEAATHYADTPHREAAEGPDNSDVNSSDDQLLAIVDDCCRRRGGGLQENAHESGRPWPQRRVLLPAYALNGVTDPHLETHLEAINACFGQPSIEEVHLVGVCVCVCVCARARVRARACVRACVRVRALIRRMCSAYIHAYISMCVCVCARARSAYIHAPMCMHTQVMEQLRELEAGGMHAGWATRTLNRLQMISPTSLRISFTPCGAVRAGLDECIRTEWRLAPDVGGSE